MAPRFYVGQPVICVDDKLRPHVVARFPGLTWPREGQRYVIRANIYGGRAGWFVLLREIVNRRILYPGTHRHAEAGFHEDRFQPATDIGLLENIRDFAGIQFERQKHRVIPFKPQRKKEKACLLRRKLPRSPRRRRPLPSRSPSRTS